MGEGGEATFVVDVQGLSLILGHFAVTGSWLVRRWLARGTFLVGRGRFLDGSLCRFYVVVSGVVGSRVVDGGHDALYLRG